MIERDPSNQGIFSSKPRLTTYVMSNRMKAALARRPPTRQELISDARWEDEHGVESEPESANEQQGVAYRTVPTGKNNEEPDERLASFILLKAKWAEEDERWEREWCASMAEMKAKFLKRGWKWTEL